jgi:transposase
MCPFDDDDELSKLKPKAISLWHTHQTVVSERDALAARVKELEAQLARKNKALFGPTSERSKKDPASAEPAASPEPSSSPQEKPKQKGHGRREQPKLRVEPVEHTLEGDELRCDQCGGTFVLFEGQEETSREIDLLRREFVELLHKRLKYRCPCGACIRTAKAPLKLKEGNLYSIKFGAHVAAQKYDQHQPLERQARVMGSEGLVIDSQTLWDQTDSVAFWSIGAYNAIKAQVLSAEIVGADETQWRFVVAPPNPREFDQRGDGAVHRDRSVSECSRRGRSSLTQARRARCAARGCAWAPRLSSPTLRAFDSFASRAMDQRDAPAGAHSLGIFIALVCDPLRAVATIRRRSPARGTAA